LGCRTERRLDSEAVHHDPSELAQPQLAIDMPGLRNSCGDDLAFHSSESPFACWPIRVEKNETRFTPLSIDAYFHASSRDGI
jgi:hypothetical protein